MSEEKTEADRRYRGFTNGIMTSMSLAPMLGLTPNDVANAVLSALAYHLAAYNEAGDEMERAIATVSKGLADRVRSAKAHQILEASGGVAGHG